MMTSLILAAAMQVGTPAVNASDSLLTNESVLAGSPRGPQTQKPQPGGKQKSRTPKKPPAPKRPERPRGPTQFL